MRRLLISLAIACAVLCGLPPAAQAAPTELSIQPSYGKSFNGPLGQEGGTYKLPGNWVLTGGSPLSNFFTYGETEFFRGPLYYHTSVWQRLDLAYVFTYDVGTYDIPTTSVHLSSNFGIFNASNSLITSAYPSGDGYGFYFAWAFIFDDGSQIFSPADFDHFTKDNKTGVSIPVAESTDLYFGVDGDVNFANVDGNLQTIAACIISPGQGMRLGTNQVLYPSISYLNVTYDPDAAFQGGVLAILYDIWETVTSVPGQILEGMAQVVSGILDGLAYMFFPPDDFMLEVWEDVTDDFESQFGAIGYTVNFVIDLLQDLNPENRPGFGSHDDEFYFPGINLEIPIFGHSYYFKIDDGWIKCFPEGLEEYQKKVKFLVTAAFCLAAMTGWIRLYEARLGIDSDFDGDEEG